MKSSRSRKLVSSLFVAFSAGSVLLALVPLGLVLFFVIGRGAQALSVAFFTHMPRPVGEPGGGMANAIVGSVMLAGFGALLAVPIGVMSGVYMSEYAGTRLAALIRFAVAPPARNSSKNRGEPSTRSADRPKIIRNSRLPIRCVR